MSMAKTVYNLAALFPYLIIETMNMLISVYKSTSFYFIIIKPTVFNTLYFEGHIFFIFRNFAERQNKRKGMLNLKRIVFFNTPTL